MSAAFRVVLAPECGTVRCEPAWSWRSRRLTDFDLWYVWAGRGRLDTPGKSFDVAAGSLFCLRPGHAYHAEQDPIHRLGVCYLHFRFARRPGRAALPPLHGHTDDADFTETVLRQAVHLRQSDDPRRHEQACRLAESVLLSMRVGRGTAAPSGTARHHRDAVAAVVRHVRENPGTLFPVADLAARAGYSVDHFARVFEQQTGQTPKDFCVATRVRRAGQLLRETAMSVEQVARALGYADVYFFSRQFKQRTGVTATAWRAGTISVVGTIKG